MIRSFYKPLSCYNVTKMPVCVPNTQRDQTIPKHQNLEHRKVCYRALESDGGLMP